MSTAWQYNFSNCNKLGALLVNLKKFLSNSISYGSIFWVKETFPSFSGLDHMASPPFHPPYYLYRDRFSLIAEAALILCFSWFKSACYEVQLTWKKHLQIYHVVKWPALRSLTLIVPWLIASERLLIFTLVLDIFGRSPFSV